MCPSAREWQPSFTLLTCEHGGNDVPEAYAQLFEGHEGVLSSHRGYDIGALGVALRLAAQLALPLQFSTVTRLLVDLNRSLDQPDVFSEFSRTLADDAKNQIVREHYRPHRESVERTIAAALAAGHRVLHVGVHSCTDVLQGVERELEVSVLFDRSRPKETAFSERLQAALRGDDARIRVPLNVPYDGADDGLTTTLRGMYPAGRYVGIEIEVRQGLIATTQGQHQSGDLIATALGRCLDFDA